MPQTNHVLVPERTILEQMTALISFAKDNIQAAANYTVLAGLKVVHKGLYFFPEVSKKLLDPDLEPLAQDFENEIVLMARYKVLNPKMHSLSSTIAHALFQAQYETEIEARKRLVMKIDKTANEAARLAFSIDLFWFVITRFVSLNPQLQLFLLSGSWLCFAPYLALQPKLTKMIESNFAMNKDKPLFFNGVPGSMLSYSYEDIYSPRDGAMPVEEFTKRMLVLAPSGI